MQFLYHNVLLLMLIPIFLLMFLVVTNKDSFEKYFEKETLSKLSVSNKYMTKTTRNILFFISIILMTIALARPVAQEKEHSFKQEVSSIVVAIDVSKSMLANDVYPNRLSLAKQKLLDIIKLSKKNALAVVLFAKSSFILSPVTQDFNSLKILVDNLDTGTNFDNGSNIFSTLETTNKLLKDYENKNLLLLTDGGNNSEYEKEIEFANKNKINIYTIALATKKASPIKLENGEFLTNKDGSIVTVALNEKIKKLSLDTNGGFINYSITNNDIKEILSDIDNKSSKKELESKKFKTYTELFYYPLGLALFILLIAFSSLPKFKSKKIAIIVTTIFISTFSTNLEAVVFDFQTIEKANNNYKQKNYKEATKNYQKVSNTQEAKYNLGNSLYKEEKYKEALNTYKNITTTNQTLEYKKLHNMGNSYVKLNDLENAKKMYENALKIKDDKQTKENLDAVNKALENKQQNKDHNKNKKQDKKDKDQKKKQKEEQKKKNKQNKEQKNKNQENKKDEQNKGNQESKKNKKQDEQKNKDKNKKLEKQKSKPQEISDLEEKKWLGKLKDKKQQVLLKRVDTKNEDTSSNPW
ncbi:VWA domain-containing protein [Arcobacter sp. LA11]|uniref:vWA domain-containing protein n=1 Tax=Arcobacter sp. LA11 TaxID=1898176 RepID=UPI0009FA233E|nr:VWA domain-containing protein [Arcobacter sp. LA11]